MLSGQGYRTSSHKYQQPPNQKPVDGLEVLKGFRCPLSTEDGTPCLTACLGQSTFMRHLSEHPGRPKVDPSFCISDVQTLFRQGGCQSYFSVDPSLSNLDPSAASVYDHAVKSLESLPKAQIPTSNHDKDRASIHWLTRWPELLEPYIKDEKTQASLKSLVSFPDPKSDPDWLMRLRRDGSRWWDVAEGAQKECSYRASVMLKCHKE